MNLISALGAYSFSDNKTAALDGYTVEDPRQLCLFRFVIPNSGNNFKQSEAMSTRAAR